MGSLNPCACTAILDTSTYILLSVSAMGPRICLLKEDAASSKAPSWHQVSIAVSELWGKEEKILLGLIKRGA